MDGFVDNFVPNGDSGPPAVDPAADFLAREQDELAGLEDVPVVQQEPETVPQTEEHQESNCDAGAGDASASLEPVADDVLPVHDTVTDNGETPATDGDTAVLSNLDTADDILPGAAVSDEGLMAAAAAQPTPERVATPVPRVEAESIRIWREEHQRKLIEKDVSEEKAKDALRDKARQELTDWYKQHDEQVAKTRQANRSAEKELVADTERPEPGTEWERIAKLCDFNPKTAKSSRDVSRMRSIILRVKQSPLVKA